jgi:hypothetical protein
VEAGRLTIWNFVGIWLGLVAYAVAWVWGGRAERFAAGVLLACCLLSFITYKWEIGGFHPASFAENCARLLIFGWLCLRSDRWWTFVITAALALILLVDVLALLDPDFSVMEAMSAQVGLGYVIDLTLLFSVFERWLADEAPAGRAAWAAADTATAARRRQKDEARLTERPRRPGEAAQRSFPGRNSALAVSRLKLSRFAEKG